MVLLELFELLYDNFFADISEKECELFRSRCKEYFEK